MLYLLFFAAGAATGLFRAVRARGNSLDIIQYTLAHAMAFGIAGIVLGVLIAMLR